jgi:hypothetical protein
LKSLPQKLKKRNKLTKTTNLWNTLEKNCISIFDKRKLKFFKIRSERIVITECPWQKLNKRVTNLKTMYVKIFGQKLKIYVFHWHNLTILWSLCYKNRKYLNLLDKSWKSLKYFREKLENCYCLMRSSKSTTKFQNDQNL